MKVTTFSMPLWLLDEVDKLTAMAVDTTGAVSRERIVYQANAVRFGCERLRRDAEQGKTDVG